MSESMMSLGAWEANILGAASRTAANQVRMATADAIQASADHVLIMELLQRGYAVAKMPPEDLVEELNK